MFRRSSPGSVRHRNVYRAELLDRQGIDARTPGNRLNIDQADALLNDARAMLEVGVRLGRIVTVAPEDVGKTSPRELRSGERFYVYRRALCRKCGARVKAVQLAGRKCYDCPREQA